MATTDLLNEIDEAAASGDAPHSILTSQMMGAVAGHAWNKSLKGGVMKGAVVEGGTRELDVDEQTDRAFRAEKAIRNAVKKGINSPREVVKGLNPSFMAEYGLFLNDGGRQDPMAELRAQLSTELGKNFTTSSPLSTGLVPFDLEAPSKLIYWFDTPLRAKIPRTKGQGTSHRTKVVTGISGSQTGGSAGNIIDHSLGSAFDTSMNLTGAAGTWPTIPGAGSQNAEDVNIPYKFFGLSESLSWLAQFAGAGFEDIAALANLVLMQEMHFADEYMMIGGSSVALTAPTVALTQRAAGTGETGVGSVTAVWVRVTARNYFGGSAASTVQTITPAGVGNVIDAVITPAANKGAQQYAVHVVQNASDPGNTAMALYATSGATKVTIQGALATSGSVNISADTGTSGTNRFEGILSVLSGQTAGSNGYPSDFKAGYVNMNVQDTLNIGVINTALQQAYNGPGAFRASPEELLCDGADAKSLSASIAGGVGTTSGYQLHINQNEVNNVTAGTAISQIVNPVTRRLLDITVHPGWLQGTAALLSYSTPNAVRNSNVFEMVMVQDMLSVAWPVIDPSYRFSMFEYGTLVAHAPQYCAVLGGLQTSNAAPWK